MLAIQLRRADLGWEAAIPEVGVLEFGDTIEACLAAVGVALAFVRDEYAMAPDHTLDPEALKAARIFRAAMGLTS